MSETSDCIVFSDAAIKRGDHIIWQHGTFAIPTGSVTAIVGTNGTGKTTMMRAELGLLPLCHGSLTVLGKPAGEMNKRIGYVPQSYVANVDSNLTAEQSVLLGLTGTRFGIHPITKAQKAKALEAMEFTGIADKAHYRLSELSGGLRQRVANFPLAARRVGACGFPALAQARAHRCEGLCPCRQPLLVAGLQRLALRRAQRFLRQSLPGGFDRALDRWLIGLELPTGIGCAIVGDNQLEPARGHRLFNPEELPQRTQR